MNPDDLNQMAQLGKAFYNSLPSDAQANLVMPASQEAGKGLGSIMTILSYPFNNLALGLNSKLAKKAKLLEQETMPKIERLKEDGIYTEDCAGLAIKALESAKYSLDSDILRSYFSELIANSLNSEHINNISPNLANILSSLSNEDALFLHRLKTSPFEKNFPLVRVTATMLDGPGEVIMIDNLICWKKGEFELLKSTIHTLESFGLIEHTYSIQLSQKSYDEIYESFKETEEFKHNEKAIIKSKIFKHVNLKKGVLEVTELGKLFLDLVVV